MALNFPSSPSVGDIYGRWTWNGIGWIATPTVAQPMLPIAGGTVTGNLGVLGHTTLNTVQSNGQASFLDGVLIEGDDAATKTYVDEAVASGGLWQGTWDAASNTPDLTDPDLHMNGWGWTIVTPDPTASYVIPATPAIPGVSGVTVYNGDHVIWSTAASTFEIVHGSSLSLKEAQDTFVAKAGDTMTGRLQIGVGANPMAVIDPSGVGVEPIQLRGHVRVMDGAVLSAGVAGSAFWVDGTGRLNLDNGLFLSGTVPTQMYAPVNVNNNVRVIGTGTTPANAAGNVTLVASNYLNGNLTLQGAGNGQGNIYAYQGYVQAYSCYFQTIGATHVSFFNNGFQINDNPGPIWGQVINISGTIPTCLYWHGFSGQFHETGGGIGIQQNYGTLTFYTKHDYTASTGGYFYNGQPGNWNWPIMGLDASNVCMYAHYGAYKPGGGPWGSMSDARTKTDVRDYTKGLNELIKLRPTVFRYNGRARQRETGKTYVGLAAEEAREVMPELVHTKRGKLDYDDDATTDILHIDGTPLQYATINALKEIERRLSALEARLA